jgi:type I restriction-modification system DNA methylase subunit
VTLDGQEPARRTALAPRQHYGFCLWLGITATQRAPSHGATRHKQDLRTGKEHNYLQSGAHEHFEKSKRQNRLLDEHLEKIVSAYQFRNEEARYSRRVSMEEIEGNDFNLNISRYISTAVAEEEIDLGAVNAELVSLEQKIECGN